MANLEQEKKPIPYNFEDEYSASVKQWSKKEKEHVKFSTAKRVFIPPHTIGSWIDYKKFIDRLREELKDCSAGPQQKCKRPMLPEQRVREQPHRWIHVELIAAKKGKEEESKTTLVMRDDNMYIKGFTGWGGRWFELLEDGETGQQRLPQEYYNSKGLEWGRTYSGIMGLKYRHQADMTLIKSAKLGKAFAERAVRMLSRYGQVGSEDDENAVRLGLAGLLVMICEAARMEPFLDCFAPPSSTNSRGDIDYDAVWNQGKGLINGLPDDMHNWKNMSIALLNQNNNNYQFKIWDKEFENKAFECVRLVLRSSSVFDSVHVKAHVEILRVKASTNPGVLAIHIVDEKKGRHKVYTAKPDHQIQQELVLDVLLDPDTRKGKYYKGISGSAYFDIEVSLADGSNVTGRWGCRKLQVVQKGRQDQDEAATTSSDNCTELVTRGISLPDNNLCNMAVTYLVMSHAVEATVVIKRRSQEDYLPNESDSDDDEDDGGSTPIDEDSYYKGHGTITAHIDGFEKYGPIVLLRTSNEKAPFRKAEEENSLTLELQRSTVQVPYGRLLVEHHLKSSTSICLSISMNIMVSFASSLDGPVQLPLSRMAGRVQLPLSRIAAQ